MIESKEYWEDTFDFITDMITIHDENFNIIRANKAAEKILGLTFLEKGNTKCYKFYHGTDAPPEGCPSCKCLENGNPSIFEIFEPHLNSFLEITAIPRLDENKNIIGLIHVIRDITERKKMEDKLMEQSLTDELTGLHNRRGFFTLFKQQIKIAERQNSEMLLLYADIDKFKEINDTLGHKEGDKAIIKTAEILKSTYRESDIVARLGGDEFVVFSVGNDMDDARKIISRLQNNIYILNATEENRYMLSLSVGIASFNPEDNRSIDETLAEADKLMYENKRLKKVLTSKTTC